MIDVNLNTVCGGYLAREFERRLPEAIEAVKKTGKAASLNIKVTFKPMEGMSTMFTSHATVKAALPVEEHGGMCQLEDGKLQTDTPTIQLNLPFPAQRTIEDAIAEAERRRDQ